jgi:hypothetical protein
MWNFAFLLHLIQRRHFSYRYVKPQANLVLSLTMKRFQSYHPLTDRLCGLVARVPWLQIQWSGFDSRRYQIFWDALGLVLGPLSLMSKTEELLGRNNSSCSLENREYGRGDLLHWPRNNLCPQKLVLTSPPIGDLSVGIVLSRNKTTELLLLSPSAVVRCVPFTRSLINQETLQVRLKNPFKLNL